MIEHADHFTDLIPGVNTYLTKRNGTVPEPVVHMEQTHGADCAEVAQFIEKIPTVDAMYTTQHNLTLAVRTADCLPILFYHPLPLIGVIHAGRKGTQNNITSKTFQKIQAQYGIEDNFSIWLGPAICFNCYQIDREKDIHFDLIKENLPQLPANSDMHFSNLCTSCRTDLFFSYRKEGPHTGRIYSLICIV